MTALASFRPRHLAWIPAALIVAYTIAAAGGFTITPDSRAAGATTTVTANVLKEIHIDLVNGSCTAAPAAGPPEAATFNYGSMSTASDDITLGSCAITFGSNNNSTAGAKLWVESTRPGASANSFCSEANYEVTCSGATFTDVATAGVTNATFLTTQGGFGLRPAGAGTCPGAGADWAATNTYGLLQDTTAGFGTQICDTNSTSDGAITVEFHANPSASQTASNYYMKAEFTAEAT